MRKDTFIKVINEAIEKAVTAKELRDSELYYTETLKYIDRLDEIFSIPLDLISSAHKAGLINDKMYNSLSEKTIEVKYSFIDL